MSGGVSEGPEPVESGSEGQESVESGFGQIVEQFEGTIDALRDLAQVVGPHVEELDSRTDKVFEILSPEQWDALQNRLEEAVAVLTPEHERAQGNEADNP